MEYRVHWLDNEMEPIDNGYIVSKPTTRDAMISVSRRIQQSGHLVPIDAEGFMLTPLPQALDQSKRVRRERALEQLMADDEV